MAAQYGHQPLIMLIKETLYGDGAITDTVTDKFADTINYKYDYEKDEVKQHTQTLEPQKIESVSGRKKGTLTMSGILTTGHTFLLDGCFMDSSAYTWQVADTNFSYAIFRAFPAAADDAGDGLMATGCRLQDLTFSRSGDLIMYEAVFRCQDIDDDLDFSGVVLTTITNTAMPELTPFKFSALTCALFEAAVTKLTDFTITLHNVYADDDLNFQNAAARFRDLVCDVNGQMYFKVDFDETHDAVNYDNINSATLKTNTITFVAGAVSWAFVVFGQYTADYALPDIQRCIYQSEHTMQIMGDASNVAITVTVV